MTLALVDATTWIGGVDYTGQSNKLSLEATAEAKETTTFGQGGYRSRIGGLKSVEAAVDGFWSSTVDADAAGNVGVGDRPVTISPTGAAGSPAYMFRAGLFEYQLGDAVGELFPFTVDLQGTDAVGVVRGQVAAPSSTSVSDVGVAGSAVNLGAVASGKFLYAAVHVLTAGTTITLDLESDSANTFASPITQATIGPLTAVGGTWMTRIAGPVADTWFRLSVTAITGTFTVAAAIAVQ